MTGSPNYLTHFLISNVFLLCTVLCICLIDNVGQIFVIKLDIKSLQVILIVCDANVCFTILLYLFYQQIFSLMKFFMDYEVSSIMKYKKCAKFEIMNPQNNSVLSIKFSFDFICKFFGMRCSVFSPRLLL
jgi:hypothetical protein